MCYLQYNIAFFIYAIRPNLQTRKVDSPIYFTEDDTLNCQHYFKAR